MKIFLNIVALILLVILVVCAILYWTKGEYYPICNVALILFIITAAAGQQYKNNDIKIKGK